MNYNKTSRSFQILNNILENKDLVLISNKTDLSDLLTGKDRPIDGNNIAFNSPFTGSCSNVNDTMMSFMAAAVAKEGISSKAFIVLDTQTLEDGGKTCQVSTHDDGRDEDDYHMRVSAFRCDLSSAVAALSILEQSPDGQDHQTARVLCNEAAIAGGVWSDETAAGQHEHTKVPRITSADYPQSKDWDQESRRNCREDPLPYIPIFRTADINLEVCETLPFSLSFAALSISFRSQG